MLTSLLILIFAKIVFYCYDKNKSPDQGDVVRHDLLSRSSFGENVIFFTCQELEIRKSDVQSAHLSLRSPPDMGQTKLEKYL